MRIRERIPTSTKKVEASGETWRSKPIENHFNFYGVEFIESDEIDDGGHEIDDDGDKWVSTERAT